MRICIVLNGLEQGGVTSSALNFCRVMSNHGHYVDLVDMCNGETMVYGGINIVHIPFLQLLWRLDKTIIKKSFFLLRPILLVLAIVKKITNKRGCWLPLIFSNYEIAKSYDVVFAFRQCAPCYYFSLHCVKAKKTVAMIHGDINYMGDISSWSYMLPQFECITCVSQAVCEGFKERFPEIRHKFSTLYNMFDINNIISKSKDVCMYAINTNKINIVTVARHDNQHKRVNRVAEICLILKNKGINGIHWYVIGDGPDFEANVSHAKEIGVNDMITFCGGLSNPFALMSRCDFMVLTSLTEAYGMVVVEGRILGLPAIVANYPSLSEILVDGVEGLVAKQDCGDIAECIIKMIANHHKILNDMKEYIMMHPFSNEEAIKQSDKLLALI